MTVPYSISHCHQNIVMGRRGLAAYEPSQHVSASQVVLLPGTTARPSNSQDVGGVSPKREPDLRDVSPAQTSSVLGLDGSGTGSRAVLGLS
ncbi:hypothetical protein NDU88_000574 [Pleurodeles waltl]|uniref:Uncharacterized protein n=1 Tax=Pleurodeles waltl TaxID=8319 RepID=A0AAV7U3V5_PLEWA|nr:hypothetical protein NDU88_000574 [Pleurodeles waltl]